MSEEQKTTESTTPVDATKATPADPVDEAKPAVEAKPAAAEAKPAAATEAKPAAAAKPTPTAKPAKAPAPPDPRVEAAKGTAERIKTAIVTKLGESTVEEVGNAHFKPMVRINKDDWARAVELLRTHPEWKLNYVECMAGTDYPDYIELSLFVQSTELGHFVCLKTRTDREAAQVPTLVASHPGVNWEEREIYDLLGVNFTDHPDLRRIMMWDEFTGHPLRKDYSAWEG